MHFFIPALFFFAPLALASPWKDDNYAVATETIVDTVFAAPVFEVVTVSIEEQTYRRHRHINTRLGSPNPVNHYQALPTSKTSVTSTLHVKNSATTQVKTLKIEDPNAVLTKTKLATSAYVSSYSAQDRSQAASSTVRALESQTATFKDAPPTTFVPNLDTTSPVYKSLVLHHHNIHRRNHSAEDLVWDDTMAKYAEIVAKTCVYGHNL